MPRRECANCDGYLRYGVVCWFCVRSFAAGALGALGAAVVAYLMRGAS